MKKSILLFVALITLSGSILSIESKSQDLSDKVVGEYKGKMRNQSADINDHKIKISKVSATEVKIQPLTGTQSETFNVTLTEQEMGSITVIKFKFTGNHLMNNGMFAETIGRLSYAIHLGGTDDRNIEVFSGTKQ